MTLVGTALNLGEEMKIYAQVLTFFIKPQIWLFHVVVLQTTAKKLTKVKNARAGRAKLLFLPTKAPPDIFFFPDSKIFQSTRSVFKSNLPGPHSTEMHPDSL